MLKKAFNPSSLHEALKFFSENEKVTLIAGGTDIMVKERVTPGGVLGEAAMGLLDIKDLYFVNDFCNTLEIGPLVTHESLSLDPLVALHAPVLKKAACVLGAPQIRHRGTIGGNICNSSPVGDLLPPLYVLGAMLTLTSPSDERIVPIADFILAPGKNILKPNEILTKITVNKIGQTDKYGFERVTPRKALAITKASLAFAADFENGRMHNVRIAMGSVGPVIVRATQTENFLEDRELTADVIAQAADMIRNDSKPISDVRSTSAYRSYITGVLLRRILRTLE